MTDDDWWRAFCAVAVLAFLSGAAVATAICVGVRA